jgi:hypothetical protein
MTRKFKYNIWRLGLACGEISGEQNFWWACELSRNILTPNHKAILLQKLQSSTW